jgi:hypothetical protein
LRDEMAAGMEKDAAICGGAILAFDVVAIFEYSSARLGRLLLRKFTPREMREKFTGNACRTRYVGAGSPTS